MPMVDPMLMVPMVGPMLIVDPMHIPVSLLSLSLLQTCTIVFAVGL